MSDIGIRRLTTTTVVFLAVYVTIVICVTLGTASTGGTGGGINAGGGSGPSHNGSNSGSSSSDCSTSGSSAGTKYQAETDFGNKKSGVAFESIDAISFCYNLDHTNKTNAQESFSVVYTFPVGPFPNANTIAGTLEVELIDADDNGVVSLTGDLSGALQASSLGFTNHGAPLGNTITTPGTHGFTVGPLAGPTSVLTSNFVQANLAFTLSPKDRVRMKGMLHQDDGVNPRVCEIPLSFQGFGLTKDMQKCANDSSKSLAKSISIGNKELCNCIKALVKNPGTAPTIADCLNADAKGKRAKADAKAVKTFDKKCTGQDKLGLDKFPPFGANDPNDPEVADAVDTTPLLLAMHAFGGSVSAPLQSFAGDKDATKCQQALIKQLKKCFEVHLKEYTSCKKKALKAGASEESALAACINADPKGKIAKACDQVDKPDKLRKVLDKKCFAKNVPLGAVFPDHGVAGNVEATHAAMVEEIPCLVCMVLGHLDNLGSIDCDLIDDGTANGSCSVW